MKIKLKYIPTITLTLTAALGSFVLLAPYASALNSNSGDARVEVADSCEFGADYSYTSNFSVTNGTASDTESDSLKPTVQVTCNSSTGFVVKAIGASPDASHSAGLDGNTAMYGGLYNGTATGPTIATGSGTTTGTIPASTSSFWGMRISSAAISSPSGATPTIASAYNTAAHNYVAVPSSETTVVTFPGSTSAVTQGTMRADYGFYVSRTQPAASYVGKVKYTIVAE